MAIEGFRGRYRFLSNFWQVGGTTVEHKYQAAKTTDRAWVERILAAPTAGTAKRLGRKVPLRPDWNEVRLGVMYELVKWKFSDAILQEMLLDTGDEELIEVNSWNDSWWGVCNGRGENHLGKILMRVRSEYRAERGDFRYGDGGDSA